MHQCSMMVHEHHLDHNTMHHDLSSDHSPDSDDDDETHSLVQPMDAVCQSRKAAKQARGQGFYSEIHDEHGDMPLDKKDNFHFEIERDDFFSNIDQVQQLNDFQFS